MGGALSGPKRAKGTALAEPPPLGAGAGEASLDRSSTRRLHSQHPPLDVSASVRSNINELDEAVLEATARPVVPRKSYAPETALEKRVVETLKTLNRERIESGNGSKAVMNKVLLNFPKMQSTFSDLHRLYNDTDTDKSGSLEIDEVMVLMSKLNPGITRETVEQIFLQSDVATDGRINFKEFLTCLALGFLLGLIPELNEEEIKRATESGAPRLFKDSKAVRKVFQLATEMYLAFDTDCRGTITFAEMERVINQSTGESEMTKNTKDRDRKRKNSLGLETAPLHQTGSPSPTVSGGGSGSNSGGGGGGVMNELLSRERWQELDWDSDGYITYQEFIFTYVKWVASLSSEAGLDSDEDD
jgi:calcium-binding protein CML